MKNTNSVKVTKNMYWVKPKQLFLYFISCIVVVISLFAVTFAADALAALGVHLIKMVIGG